MVCPQAVPFGRSYPHFFDFAPLSPLSGAHLYPHLSDFAPLAPFRGEGLGVRGFALRSDWVLGFASNALLCLEGLNKSLNRRLVADNSTPHPPAPSPRNGARGRKSQGFLLISRELDF